MLDHILISPLTNICAVNIYTLQQIKTYLQWLYVYSDSLYNQL